VRCYRTTRRFVFVFLVASVFIFVDLRFLAFFPLTIREPLSTRDAALVALLGGLCAGIYVTANNK
jgi:hypothetical protein